MLKKYEPNLLDFTANIVIIVLAVVSLAHYFVLSTENRLWPSYFDVGILTAAFVIISYWLGCSFKNIFCFYIDYDKAVEINFRNLWVLSAIAGFLNGFMASYMYIQMPSWSYKFISIASLLGYMVIGFIMAVAEVSDIIEKKKKELNNNYLRLLEEEQ